MKHNELYQTFADSEHGKNLAEKTRFGVFQPEFASTDLWCEVLGNDVNNLRHMAHTAFLAEKFAAYQDLSTDTTNLLLTTAATHDWGEAIIGDIPLPDKTADHETEERVAYALIAQDLLNESQGADLTNKVWSVLSHEDEEAGEMFKTIEYVGYCTTAVRAGRMALMLANNLTTLPISRVEKDYMVSGLSGLNLAVQSHNYATLAGLGKKYPAVSDMMKEAV